MDAARRLGHLSPVSEPPFPRVLEPLRGPLDVAAKPAVVARVRGLHQTLVAAAARIKEALPADARPHLDALGAAPTPPAEPEPAAPPRRRRAPVAPPAPALRDALAAPVRTLPGVGSKLAATMEARSILTLADLLRVTPRAYEDRTSVRPIASLEIGERALVTGDVLRAGVTGWGGQRRFEVDINDGTESIRLTYFTFNAQFLTKRFTVGAKVRAAGLVSRYGRARQMVHPEVQSVDTLDQAPPAIVPVYPEVEGVPRVRLRRLVSLALDAVRDRVPEVLPPFVRDRVHLPPIWDAFSLIHRPPPDADVEKLNFRDTPAHKRLAFEEFFIMQVALGRRRLGQARHKALALPLDGDPDTLLRSFLPFTPTGAQRRVVGEILADMARPEPMGRLLQGDVGSGKTAVAAAACVLATRHRGQAAVVAPTEILAEQHFRNLTRMLGPTGVVIDLLTGSLTAKERVSALGRLAQGVTQAAVGTHALLQEDVRFHRLALAVIDEQHRFGVEQRVALRQKGPHVDGVEHVPHLLVMTATPIPRTLALTLYGDLELSVLDEMPPGRKPVVTHLVTDKGRARALEAVRRALRAGRQAFVVYPLVEESEKSDLADATQGAEEMRGHFPEAQVELLHGRMVSADKERVMARFVRGEAGLLVSTTVVEVGVDVPNATIMWVEHAERFGLSQLHQLRGRVGRGTEGAECFLVAYKASNEEAVRRLQVMAATQDGFRIAEEDLAIRGPGDLLGTKQTGAPPFLYASLLRHGAMLEEARRQAQALLKIDPELHDEAHQPLRAAIEERYEARLGLADSG